MTLKNKDNIKNDDDIKNLDDLKNEDILKKEDNTKSTASTTLPEKNCWWILSLTGTAKLTQNRKCYQLCKPEIEFTLMKEMYAALGMHTCSEKTTF